MSNNNYINQYPEVNASTNVQTDQNQSINQYQRLNNPYANQYPQIDIAVQISKRILML